MAVSKKDSTTQVRRPRRTGKRAPMAIEADQGHELLDLYIAELSRTPVLAAEAQKELARRMRHSRTSAQDKAVARAELISANLRFAFSVAKQYQNRGLSLEDLVGEANAGLCRAADKYDPDVGVNFISYAVWWIKQALHASITTKGRSVRLPLGRAGDLSRVVKAQAALRAALGREPTHEEIGRMCGLSAEIAGSLTALVQPERSLDEPLESGGSSRGGAGRTLASVIGADEEAEERLPGRLEDEDRGNALRLALEPLPARDRQVLIMYYGLEGNEAQTLEEIGNILGVTRERVRQLRDRALAALRSGDATEVLRDWAA
jgi:RNA polymerase primary sigma factor